MLSDILKEKGYKFFRNEPFVDREEEVEFLKEYFEDNPRRILFIYGPKSTGKTTLIEYLIENELNDKEYWINYLNLRRTLISNYENFIYSFFEEADEETTTEVNRTYDLKLFKLEAKTLKKVKERRINLFAELIRQFESIDKKKLFIIDEIQTLEDIYINGDKELLKEFLNFCVSLTKETHLSHVVILTSNTIFLNKIYNDSKLKITSDFKLIKHPNEIVSKKLLEDMGYNKAQVKLIIEYFGTTIAFLLKVYTYVKPSDSIEELKDFLDKEKLDAKMQIDEILTNTKKYNLPEVVDEEFTEIAREITKEGFFDYENKDRKIKQKLLPIIEILCEKEILFFDPQTGIITPNSRIYLKAMENIMKL
jgi:AAA+ ATPase superfamily predicted ATPase